MHTIIVIVWLYDLNKTLFPINKTHLLSKIRRPSLSYIWLLDSTSTLLPPDLWIQETRRTGCTLTLIFLCQFGFQALEYLYYQGIVQDILNYLTMEDWKIAVALFPSKQSVFPSELLKLPHKSPRIGEKIFVQ